MVMIGVDEVGRGAWAGPLLVCAARLHTEIPGIADSKLLTKKRREELNVQIQKNADIGYGWVDAAEIDAIGLSAALKLATKRALGELQVLPNEEIIIDGLINFAPMHANVRVLPKADQLVPAVSAASIAAKVARDARMAEIAKIYTDYGFEKHVGYGTALHAQAIIRCGLCNEHRRSFKLPAPT